MVRFVTILLAAATLSACKTFDFEGLVAASSSVQERFRDSRSTELAGFYPAEVACTTDGYRFSVATDIHLRDDQQQDFGHYLAAVRNDEGLFTALLGDYLHTAGRSLTPLLSTMLLHPDVPCFPAIGNHDVYKDGYAHSYRRLFGPTSYSFAVRTPSALDLCIVLDSANGTLGRDQYDWLASLLKERDNYRHCFVFTHANFFLPDGASDMVSTYPTDEYMRLLDLFSRRRVTTVFTGHSHTHDITTLRRVSYVTLSPLLNHSRAEYAWIECRADGSVVREFRRL